MVFEGLEGNESLLGEKKRSVTFIQTLPVAEHGRTRNGQLPVLACLHASCHHVVDVDVETGRLRTTLRSRTFTLACSESDWSIPQAASGRTSFPLYITSVRILDCWVEYRVSVRFGRCLFLWQRQDRLMLADS